MTPRVVAEIIFVGLVATPTCDAPPPLESKKTRSPAWICERSTDSPCSYWAKLDRPSLMPAALKAKTVRPEQSKLSGPSPPEP
jgi:hypothetical protein